MMPSLSSLLGVHAFCFYLEAGLEGGFPGRSVTWQPISGRHQSGERVGDEEEKAANSDVSLQSPLCRGTKAHCSLLRAGVQHAPCRFQSLVDGCSRALHPRTNRVACELAGRALAEEVPRGLSVPWLQLTVVCQLGRQLLLRPVSAL